MNHSVDVNDMITEFFAKGGEIKVMPVKTTTEVIADLKVAMAKTDWRRTVSDAHRTDDAY